MRSHKKLSHVKRALGFIQAANPLSSTGGKEAPLPRFLTYIVTFNCNARCIMCDSWKKVAKDDLSLEEIESIFKQLPQMDGIRLTGGEPFVRKDFPEIFELAREHLDPHYLHITTNGFLTDRILSFCENRKGKRPLNLLVSMDGTEDTHNRVRGQSFAWERTYETIRALAGRRDEWNLRLAVNQTIVDEESAEEYSRLRDRLRPLGIYNRPVIAYEASATYSLTRGVNMAPSSVGSFSTFEMLPKDRLERLFAEIERDVARLPFTDRAAKQYYLDGIRSRLLDSLAKPSPDCVALNHHLRIFPNGDVPTCQFNTRTVGNLREQSFDDIWASASKNDQREWVKKCPGCWAECEVIPNAIYSGDLARHSLKLRIKGAKKTEKKKASAYPQRPLASSKKPVQNLT